MRGLFLCAVLLAGCKRKEEPVAAAPTPAAALPVVAPMQARERILGDLERQKAAARARKADFDAVLEGRDR